MFDGPGINHYGSYNSASEVISNLIYCKIKISVETNTYISIINTLKSNFFNTDANA